MYPQIRHRHLNISQSFSSDGDQLLWVVVLAGAGGDHHQYVTEEQFHQCFEYAAKSGAGSMLIIFDPPFWAC
jgi:hypothetical protein